MLSILSFILFYLSQAAITLEHQAKYELSQRFTLMEMLPINSWEDLETKQLKSVDYSSASSKRERSLQNFIAI